MDYIKLKECVSNRAEFGGIPDLMARVLPGVHRVHWNQFGALSVECKPGQLFGIKPGEFSCWCDADGNERAQPENPGLASVWDGNRCRPNRAKDFPIPLEEKPPPPTGQHIAIGKPREIQGWMVFDTQTSDSISRVFNDYGNANLWAVGITAPIQIRHVTIQIGAVVQVESAKGENPQ